MAVAVQLAPRLLFHRPQELLAPFGRHGVQHAAAEHPHPLASSPPAPKTPSRRPFGTASTPPRRNTLPPPRRPASPSNGVGRSNRLAKRTPSPPASSRVAYPATLG